MNSPSANPMLCPNCGKDEVGTFIANDSFMYGIKQPVRLIAKDVEFFRCMACEQTFTGEDGEIKRQRAVDDYLADEVLRRMTAAMREADQTFERVGGSTRHHVRDCLLPILKQHGLELRPIV